MWANLSYRKKLKLLGVAALLLLMVCYRFSIAHTLAEYRLYSSGSQAGNIATANSGSDQYLEKKDRLLTSLFDQYTLDTTDNARNLLSIAGNFCQRHQLILREYKPFSGAQADTLRLFTRIITVEGSFSDCLRLVYALETKHQAGKVSAVQFKSGVDPKTKDTYLQCTLYVQNLINSSYEQQ